MDLNNDDLKKQFNEEVESLLQKTKEEISYPAYFYKLSKRVGGHLEATKILIHKSTTGFKSLVLKRRLDLSVEKVVIKDKYKNLFTEHDIKICKEKLGRR